MLILEDKNESLYATYDPFDYMYSPSISSQSSDPIYAAVIKTPISSPPPLPPRTSLTPKESKVNYIKIYLLVYNINIFFKIYSR